MASRKKFEEQMSLMHSADAKMRAGLIAKDRSSSLAAVFRELVELGLSVMDPDGAVSGYRDREAEWLEFKEHVKAQPRGKRERNEQLRTKDRPERVVVGEDSEVQSVGIPFSIFIGNASTYSETAP